MPNSKNNEAPLALENALAKVADSFRAVLARVAEIIKPIIEAIKPMIDALVNSAIFAYMAERHPKWWHYYRHAKRRRIRKKYRDKLLREMIALIEKGVI